MRLNVGHVFFQFFCSVLAVKNKKIMKACDYLFAIGMPTVLNAGCPIFLAVALLVA